MKKKPTNMDEFTEAFNNVVKWKERLLQPDIDKFFKEFAESQPEDAGKLTEAEIKRLRGLYNQIVKTHDEQFEKLQKLSAEKIEPMKDKKNTLTGAIKGITEEQAKLLVKKHGSLKKRVDKIVKGKKKK